MFSHFCQLPSCLLCGFRRAIWLIRWMGCTECWMVFEFTINPQYDGKWSQVNMEPTKEWSDEASYMKFDSNITLMLSYDHALPSSIEHLWNEAAVCNGYFITNTVFASTCRQQLFNRCTKKICIVDVTSKCSILSLQLEQGTWQSYNKRTLKIKNLAFNWRNLGQNEAQIRLDFWYRLY